MAAEPEANNISLPVCLLCLRPESSRCSLVFWGPLQISSEWHSTPLFVACVSLQGRLPDLGTFQPSAGLKTHSWNPHHPITSFAEDRIQKFLLPVAITLRLPVLLLAHPEDLYSEKAPSSATRPPRRELGNIARYLATGSRLPSWHSSCLYCLPRL
jgi:hypothetical protein